MFVSLKDQMTDSLRGRILAGEWSPGARLKEEELAQEFGVSRGPVRDVMLRLTKEGYLELLPNKGASVKMFADPDARSLLLSTRRELEILALQKGFPQWAATDLKELEKILRRFRSAAEAGDLAEVIQYDVAFHRFIVERYPGNTLAIVWLSLMTTLALPYSRHADLMESYQEHVVIYEALRSSQVKRAATLLKKHIQ